jgi:pantetheine-phosphate adenylyltransferase
LAHAKTGFKYNTVAVGGTFDIIHSGHLALLQRAFETGEHVVIGLTSDDFAAKEGKKIRHTFAERSDNLRSYLSSRFPDRNFRITELDRTFGPGIFTSSVEAIVASAETAGRVDQANAKRRELGLPDLKIEVVPLILAKDGERISSTRIRNREIDETGNAIKDV